MAERDPGTLVRPDVVGIRAAVAPGTIVTYNADGTGIDGSYKAAIAVVGEPPYAEGAGDRPGAMGLDATDLATISRLRRALLSGYDSSLHPDQPAFRLFLIQHLLCHWQGLLKRSAAVSWSVRGFNRWVAYRHKVELDRLTRPLLSNAR